MKIRVLKIDEFKKYGEVTMTPVWDWTENMFREPEGIAAVAKPGISFSSIGEFLKKGILPIVAAGLVLNELYQSHKLNKQVDEVFEKILAEDEYLQENKELAYRLFLQIKKMAPHLSTHPDVLKPILHQAVTLQGITPELARAIIGTEKDLENKQGIAQKMMNIAKGI